MGSTTVSATRITVPILLCCATGAIKKPTMIKKLYLQAGDSPELFEVDPELYIHMSVVVSTMASITEPNETELVVPLANIRRDTLMKVMEFCDLYRRDPLVPIDKVRYPETNNSNPFFPISFIHSPMVVFKKQRSLCGPTTLKNSCSPSIPVSSTKI